MKLKVTMPKRPKTSARPTVPAPIYDLYRDMRDRRLLLPAVVLIVAIIAVPVALSADSQAPPPPLAFVPPEGSEAVAPAVLTEEPAGVRDYRQRLSGLKEKNPFAEKFKAPKETSAGGLAPPEPIPVEAPPASIETRPTPIFGGAEQQVAPPVPGEPDSVELTDRIDAWAGLKGSGRKLKGVEAGDSVPSRQAAPVLIFINANRDLTKARFAVSRDVTDSDGDGSCKPRRGSCQTLMFKPGEKRVFTYGPHDRTYTVRVIEIYQKSVSR